MTRFLLLIGIMILIVLTGSVNTSASLDPPVCGYSPLVAELLEETDQHTGTEKELDYQFVQLLSKM